MDLQLPTTLSQEHLRTIVRVCPNTTRLIPIDPQPQQGLTATKFNAKQLLIGTKLYSMARLAYLYHHGKVISRVTHLDGNADNYSPDNLIPYKPRGRRPASAPIPHAIPTGYGAYYVALKPPQGVTSGKVLLATDAVGSAIVQHTPATACRVASKYAKTLTLEELKTLGML